MALDFTPQFHRKTQVNGTGRVWVAAPPPPTVVPLKKDWYRTWQQEECRRLKQAGETVVRFSADQ